MIIQTFDHVTAALQYVADVLACVGPLARNAVVFDIDDTILASDTGAPDPAVALFWSLCGTLRLRRFIVTARPDSVLPDGDTNRAVTVAELHSHGIRHWDGLFLMPEHEFAQCDGDASAFKHRARRHIVDHYNEGVPLVLTIGDQWGDVARTTSGVPRKWRRLDSAGIHVGFFDDTAVLGIKLPREP